MSSRRTSGLPAMRATALAASRMAFVARGPAPQATNSFVYSEASGDAGRVRRTILATRSIRSGLTSILGHEAEHREDPVAIDDRARARPSTSRSSAG